MSVTPVQDGPCWWLGHTDGPHFATEADALDWAGRVMLKDGAKIQPMPVLCYALSCDGCGYVDGDDDSDVQAGYHYPAFLPEFLATDAGELHQVDGGRLLCATCRHNDPAVPPPAPPAVLEFLDWLLRMDDPFDLAGQEARKAATLTDAIDRAYAVWGALGLPNQPDPNPRQSQLL